MNPKLSIIIVNYNGKKFLRDCFLSIQKQLTHNTYEVVMVDNLSSDDSVSFTRENFPWVNVIEAKSNLGFGKANNLAVKHAVGDYVLLLNNDTILLNNPLDLIKEFDQHHELGAIGIKMLNENGKYTYSFGNFPNFENLFLMKNLQKMRNKDILTGHFKNRYYPVDWLSGSFILMPKPFFERIGGFDEDYFLYVEDVDLGKRIQIAGKQSWLFPEQSYIHFVGFNANKNIMLVRGYKMFLQKHTNGFKYLFFMTALTINAFVKKIKLRNY